MLDETKPAELLWEGKEEKGRGKVREITGTYGKVRVSGILDSQDQREGTGYNNF